MQHLARILRHEVADLLQGLYSVTAILQTRLPATLTLEKQLLVNLKTRAEDLRGHLDGLTQLASVPYIERTEQSLGEALRIAMQRTQRQHPDLPIVSDLVEEAVWADPSRLLASCTSLVATLAGGARSLHVHTSVKDGFLQGVIHRIGTSASVEQLAWLEQPFPNTHFSPLSLTLALTAQWLPAVGGELQVVNHPTGCEVQLRLPRVLQNEDLK
jgi:hypothetical protein